MEVWNPEHPHHAVWREYTQSLLDGKPKVVEIKRQCRNDWIPFTKDQPMWGTCSEYRIARSTLKLAYTVPMPVTKPLEEGQVYWFDSIGDKPVEMEWDGVSVETDWFKAGRIYLTQEDAQAAIDARAAAMRAALEAAK